MRVFLVGLLPLAAAHTTISVSTPTALREAITDGAHIEVANDMVLDEEMVIPTGYDVEITSANGATLVGNDWERHFLIEGKLRLENLVLTNGTQIGHSRNYYGGAIYVEKEGSLTLVDCIVANSTASFGGGVYAGESTNIEIYRTTFTGNRVQDYKAGGAIYTAHHRSLKVVESLFVANVAPKGGAIQAAADGYGNTEIFNTKFVGNTAAGSSMVPGVGGAIALHTGPLTISGSTFVDNIASTHGSAIYINPPSVLVTVVSTTFEGNVGEGILTFLTGQTPPVLDCAATCDGLGGGTCAPIDCAGCPYGGVGGSDCTETCTCSSCDCTYPTFPTPQPTGPSPAPTVTRAPTLAPHDASWWRANAGTTDGAAGSALSPLAVLAAILVLVANEAASLKSVCIPTPR